MAQTYVLVHGSNEGGWVWKQVARLLRARGNEVYTPTLTGLSDRLHLLTCEVNLTTHIIDVVNLINYEDLSDVILVGNSYGGMVITGVAAKIPERLKLLIYLDAYVPDPGQSEADLLPSDMFAARQADAAMNNGLIPPPPPVIFGITEPTLAKWINTRTTPHPLATYVEPVMILDNRSDEIPRVFIHCTGNPPTTPDLFAASAEKARSKGWPVIDLPSGHLAMLTAPEAVADILVRYVRES